MQYTLKRVKAIFSANYNSFISSALLTALIVLITYLVFNNISSPIEDFDFTNSWQLIAALLFFAVPLLEYLAFHISNISNGLTGVQLDTKITKRNLFLLAGTSWASAGSLIVCNLVGSLDYLAFASAVLLILSWHFINKLLLKYVFTL